MKILFRILVGLVVLVVLVLGAAYFILTGYDREELKQIAEEQVEAATGRDFSINGPLDFSISLSPAIVIEDVSFGNAPWGTRDTMASMKRFELELALIPLITGDIEINRIVLVEPDLYIETNAAGKGNWELDVPAEPETEEGGGMQLSSINAISITDAKATYRDGVTGEVSEFTISSLTGSAPSAEAVNVDMKGSANGIPFTLDAGLTASGENYTVDNADFTFGDSNLKGSGALAMGGARPKLTASFTSTMIDLTSLPAGAGDEGATAEVESTSPYLFSPDPLPIGALRAADADVDIKVDTIRVLGKAEVKDAEIKLTLNNGDLNISKLKGASMGGTVDMTARLNGAANPAQLTSKLVVDNLNYGEVLKTMDISEDVDGIIDISYELRGSGNSMRAIASNLSGYEEIVATDGIITNKLLAIVSTGLDEIMGPLLGGKKDTKLNCFISRFDINGGMATSRAFVVDSTTFTVGGEGTVNLRDESLNLSFDTRTRDSAIVSLAVPFRVKGTLASPNAFPDPLGTAKGAANLAKGVGKLFDKGGDDGSGDSGKKKNPFGKVLGALGGGDKEETAQDQPGQDACAAALRSIGR